MHTRLALVLAVAIAIAGCTAAVRLTDTSLTIEWPKVPDLGIPLPR